MISGRYATGAAYLIVAPGGAALLPSDIGADVVERVWALLRADAGLADVLQALTGASLASLSDIPHFAVALVSGATVHVAVRGTPYVTVVSATEPVTITGD